MAEDTSKDSEKKPSYLPIAGALFLGIVVGAALGSGDEAALRVKRDLEERLEQAQQAAAEAVAAAEQAAEGAASQAATAASEQVTALEGKIGDLESALAEAGDSEEVAAIRNRVQVLAEQMAATIAAMQSGAGMAPAASGDGAPAKPAAEAAPQAAQGGDADVAALEEAIGADGLVLAVGQTGSVGETRVFMSRLDSEAMEARVMVVGQGPATVGRESGPIEVGGGCSLSLEGIADRRAYLKPSCD
jgi:hypothetical protein